jgi:hypothetical protein
MTDCTVPPATAPAPVRLHQAFLASYAPSDEGLYDDHSTRRLRGREHSMIPNSETIELSPSPYHSPRRPR